MGCLQYQLVLAGFLNHQLSLRTNDLSIQVSPITNLFFLAEWPRFRAWFHDISWHETPIWRQCWWMVLVSRDLFSASNSSNWLGVVKHVGVSFKMMLHFVFQKLPCFEHIQMKAAAPAPSRNKWKSNNKNWKKTLSQMTWKVCCWSRSTAYYFQPDLNMLRFLSSFGSFACESSNRNNEHEPTNFWSWWNMIEFA